MIVFFLNMAFAEPSDLKQRIYLSDGSVLTGELLSFDGTSYLFKTESLGEIALNSERVQRLETISSSTPSQGSATPTQPSSFGSSTYTQSTPSTPRAPAIPKQPKSSTTLPSMQGGVDPASMVISTMQSVIMQDDEIMGLVLQLQSDPNLMILMSDPQVMQAIQTGDFKALEQHPAMKDLMNSPQMKQIQEYIQP
ncbi:MAG: hypothetical protein CMK59_07525 [Proteobacteria bacterium]|nr:hypothetical protein [Pseudomonadota bacterium]